MAFDFLFNSLILFFNNVNVTVEVVNVVDEGVVLLFGFAESRYNLIVGADASLFLNLFKSILNNLDVSNIHVHELFLFLVVGQPFVQSTFEESDRVCKFSSSHSSGSGTVFMLHSGALFVFIAFLEFLLEFHDFHLEHKLILLVLCLKSKDLVVGGFRMALTLHNLLVHFSAVIADILNFFTVTLIDR